MSANREAQEEQGGDEAGHPENQIVDEYRRHQRCWPRKRSGDICWMFVSGTRAAASRPAITVSSSSTEIRWAWTGRCLKKDPASQAEAAAADAFPCRSAENSRRGWPS